MAALGMSPLLMWTANFLASYEIHLVEGRELQEYWIPAEDLNDFNDHIVGLIEVLSERRGSPAVRIS